MPRAASSVGVGRRVKRETALVSYNDWVSVKCGPDGGGWRMADDKMRIEKCG